MPKRHYKRQKFSSCHDFSVYACVATLTVAALAVGMSMRYLTISGEDLAAYLLVGHKSCLYNDQLVNQCAARSGSPRDEIITLVC